MNYLALSRGFVVKKDFLMTNENFLQGKNVFEDEGLIRINSTQSLEYVFKRLSDRIREFHTNNGVIILGKDSVYIDADVEIGGGTIIYPNNTILGESVIGDNVCLESGNYIKNSIICNDVKLSNCKIIKSKVSKDAQNKNIEGEKI
jgi:bifunctional UDP-N-acetylglucosamine pyrophosphorylase/glucosamine-1-phosphate N-acetyltransferase